MNHGFCCWWWGSSDEASNQLHWKFPFYIPRKQASWSNSKIDRAFGFHPAVGSRPIWNCCSIADLDSGGPLTDESVQLIVVYSNLQARTVDDHHHWPFTFSCCRTAFFYCYFVLWIHLLFLQTGYEDGLRNFSVILLVRDAWGFHYECAEWLWAPFKWASAWRNWWWRNEGDECTVTSPGSPNDPRWPYWV